MNKTRAKSSTTFNNNRRFLIQVRAILKFVLRVNERNSRSDIECRDETLIEIVESIRLYFRNSWKKLDRNFLRARRNVKPCNVIIAENKSFRNLYKTLRKLGVFCVCLKLLKNCLQNKLLTFFFFFS